MQLTRYDEILSSLIGILKLEVIKNAAGKILFNSTNTSLEIDGPALVEMLLTARERLHLLCQDDEVRALAESLGIGDIFGAKTTSLLIVGLQTQRDTHSFRSSNAHFLLLGHLYWQLVATIDHAASLKKFVITERAGEINESCGILPLEVLDLGREGFEPTRIAEILKTLEPLFNAVGRAANLADTSISIAYLDSGSNAVLGIKAATDLIKEVKTLLLEVLPLFRDWKGNNIPVSVALRNLPLGS